MTPKLTYVALLLYALAYLLLFLTWVAVEFNRDKVPHPDQMISYIQTTLGALTGHVITMINPSAPGQGVQATPPSNPQSGFANPFLLFGMVLGIVGILCLPGCSLMPAAYQQYEKDAGQIVVQSAERTVCKDIPIGIWLEQYGSNPTRLQGWQNICGNPIQNPLDPKTVAAILKVYPSFDPLAPQPLSVIAPAIVQPSAAIVLPGVLAPAAGVPAK